MALFSIAIITSYNEWISLIYIFKNAGILKLLKNYNFCNFHFSCKSLTIDSLVPNNVMKVTAKLFLPASSISCGERTEIGTELQHESARQLCERREELHAVLSSTWKLPGRPQYYGITPRRGVNSSGAIVCRLRRSFNQEPASLSRSRNPWMAGYLV